MGRQPKNPAGFSLLELMVVIAIISLLAALLLPVLLRSLQRARQVQCLNNVKQIDLGLLEWVGETHYYPLFHDFTLSNGVAKNGTTWERTIQNSIGSSLVTTGISWWNHGIWLCPGVTSQGLMKGGYSCYGYNAFGLGSDTNSLGLGGTYGYKHTVSVWIGKTSHDLPLVKPAVAESSVAHPSAMITVGDGFDGNGDIIDSGANVLWRKSTDQGAFPTTIAMGRHNGKANIAFGDGHVEIRTLKSLFHDTNVPALSQWNRDHLPHQERLQ
ncbi:MAG TPA: prepilin-type N-terminal cleavage/methylation domain-containing protein [Verrucomicrobiae bacterium]